MGRLAVDVVANYAGKAWTIILGIAVVPLYLRYVGVEAYGLIGILVLVQSIVAILDFGFSTTLNRQLASYRDDAAHARELVRTLEWIYWPLAGAVAAVGVAAAPLLAAHWGAASALSVNTIAAAWAIIAIAGAAQLPFLLYSGGLLGLQRQVAYNVLVVSMTTLRAFGALAILRWVSPSIVLFLAWQAAITLLQTLLAALLVWRTLPAGAPARFALATLRRHASFALGVSGIALLGALLANVDKLVLSRLLTLEAFGYYSLASVVASGVYLLSTPVFISIFPRLSQAAARHDEATALELFRRAAQLLAVTLVPIVAVCVAFAEPLVRVWTRDPLIAASAAPLVRLLCISYLAVAYAGLAYTLQTAHGRTRPALLTNVVAVVVAAPLVALAAARAGPVGAATAWVCVSSAYLVALAAASVPHLRGLRARDVMADVLAPLLVSAAVVAAAWLVQPASLRWSVEFLFLGAVTLAAVGAAVLAAPYPRAVVRRLVTARLPEATHEH